MADFSRLPLQWWYDRTPRIAGQSFSMGFFYTGHLVSDGVSEPSMVDPSLRVDDSDACLSVRGPSVASGLSYRGLSALQRGAYLRFLASSRLDCSEIGYVLLYLTGLERRLIMDKDKMVEGEHVRIVQELIRLLGAYGDDDRIAMRIRLLLLFDEYLFAHDDMVSNDVLIKTFMPRGCAGLSRTATNRSHAHVKRVFLFMLLCRLSQRNMKHKMRDIFDFVMWEVLLSRGYSNLFPPDFMTNQNYKILKNDIFRVWESRVRHIDKTLLSKQNELNHGSYNQLTYPPLNLELNRKNSLIKLTSNNITYDNLNYSLSIMMNMFINAYQDIMSLSKYSSMSSREKNNFIRNASDTGRMVLEPDVCMRAMVATGHLDTKKDETFLTRILQSVPFDKIQTLTQTFSNELPVNSKNILTNVAEEEICIALNSIGLQPILTNLIQFPDNLKRINNTLADSNTNIICYNRGIRFDKTTGKQSITPIINDITFPIIIPETCLTATNIAIINGWFATQTGIQANDPLLTHFPWYLIPDNIPNQQTIKTLMLALTQATINNPLTQQTINKIIKQTPLNDIQESLFNICQHKYPDTLPTPTIKALEHIYQQHDIPTQQVLYDYTAGEHRITRNTKTSPTQNQPIEEFKLNHETLQTLINETTEAQETLNLALEQTTTDNQEDPNTNTDNQEHPNTNNTNQPETSTATTNAQTNTPNIPQPIQIINELFTTQDTDEIPINEIINTLKQKLNEPITTTQIMQIITQNNEETGNLTYEIEDGMCYKN